ncbi:type II toxin-antitoxin system HicB family antitoxin [Candidatus Parcubacteria bacterium]|nr:type II toxin-antitoxin system HicB family antitoxin [Candidatus Parcubacteria bacterium]
MKFNVILEPQTEGGYTAYVPELPGCISEGGSIDEAMAMIQDAISGYVAVLDEKGWELPKIQHRQVTVV